MRRRNRVITFQWEPFTATISATGLAYITVNQTVSNLPPYPIRKSYVMKYKNATYTTFLQIDPSANPQIRFYLGIDGSEMSKEGDSFEVFGGSAEWITQ
jgi:hypothetical protein